MKHARSHALARQQDRRLPWLITALVAATLAVAAAWTPSAHAQGFLDKLFNKATGNTASYDESLANAVRSKLAGHPELGKMNLSVAAKDGIITLGGSAGNAGQKETAEQVAKSVSGVRGVNNAISLL